MARKTRSTDGLVEQEQHISEKLAPSTKNVPETSNDLEDPLVPEENAEVDRSIEESETSLSSKRRLSDRAKYRRYTQEDKSNVFFLVHNKAMSPSDAALKIGIPLSTVKGWLKKDEQLPDYSFTKEKAKCGPCPDIPKLTDEQTRFLVNEVDNDTSITIIELFDKFTNAYNGVKVSKAGIGKFVKENCYLALKLSKNCPEDKTVSNHQIIKERSQWVSQLPEVLNPLNNCIFVGEATFTVSLMKSFLRNKTGKKLPPTIKTTTTTVLGAISGKGSLHFEVKYKRPAPSLKRRKLTDGSIVVDGGSASHYLNFIHSLVEKLKSDSQYDGCYILLENVPLQNQRNVEAIIESKNFKYLYLPRKSSDLNAIEDFWPIVQGYIKRTRLDDDETMEHRIQQGANAVSSQEYSKICSWVSKSIEKARA